MEGKLIPQCLVFLNQPWHAMAGTWNTEAFSSTKRLDDLGPRPNIKVLHLPSGNLI